MKSQSIQVYVAVNQPHFSGSYLPIFLNQFVSLEPNPMHVHSYIYPITVNVTFSHENVVKIVASESRALCYSKVLWRKHETVIASHSLYGKTTYFFSPYCISHPLSNHYGKNRVLKMNGMSPHMCP